MKRVKIEYVVPAIISSLTVLGIFLFEPPKSFLFINAKGDCSGRTVFMYNALYRNPVNADIVLFGSSKTLNAINDSMLNRKSGKRYLNLGYCRFGRDLDYFFIEEYCKTHHPSILVLEVRREESEGSHPLTPFLMPLDKVFQSASTLHKDAFSDIYNKWLCNLKYFRKSLFSLTDTVVPNTITHCGFWQGFGKPEKTLLEEEKRKENHLLQKLSEKAAAKPGAGYFENLKALCEQNKIKLYFLYLSSYGNVFKNSLHNTYYLKYGAVLNVPDSIYSDPQNFSDYGHFNLNGANKTSIWLASQLE